MSKFTQLVMRVLRREAANIRVMMQEQRNRHQTDDLVVIASSKGEDILFSVSPRDKLPKNRSVQAQISKAAPKGTTWVLVTEGRGKQRKFEYLQFRFVDN